MIRHRIRTRTRGPIRRAGAWPWEASERHPGIMLTLIGIIWMAVGAMEQTP